MFIRVPKNKRRKKMSFLLKVVIFWTIFTSTVKHIHALDVDPNGIYSDIIVEISDKVPRQKCQRALDNLEVRTYLLPILLLSILRHDCERKYLLRGFMLDSFVILL